MSASCETVQCIQQKRGEETDMRRLFVFLIILMLIAGCGDEPTKQETTGYGRMKVSAFDAPPPSGVEHIYLTITEVSVHSSDRGWVTLAEPNATYDFLELINGATAVLADTTLEAGHYTQMRLVVGETNEIVVDGEIYPLTIPSGEQSGVKLNLNVEVAEDELIEVLVDFDASKSITWTPKKYMLRPSFRTFTRVVSGTLSGTVKDAAGVDIPNALVEASSSDDTISTVTDSTGAYTLILVEGIYDLEASAEGYTSSDPSYAGVEMEAGVDLTGYDFALQK